MTTNTTASTGERCIDKYATYGERRVAGRLIRAALDLDYTVSVNDGEETTVRRARTWAPVMEALATTGEDYVTMHDRDGNRVGVFYLVYGNDDTGEELIADHSDNPDCEALYNVAYNRATVARPDWLDTAN